MGKAIARFDSPDRAERAVDELKREGFTDKEISLVAKDPREGGHAAHPAGAPHQGKRDDGLWDGTAVGAGVGVGAGLLATAGLLVIPGIGPLLALGPLAATLGLSAAGGLAGAFVDWGVPSGESERLQKDVERGEAVVLVDSGKIDRAVDILKRHTNRVQTVH